MHFLSKQIFKRLTRQYTMSTIKYLNQAEATQLDQDLFNEYKFSVDQLMELAGLSCSHAVAKCFPQEKFKNVLICCGPGNNGGDGLVCARHLSLMNYKPEIYYVKKTDKELYNNLIHQCISMGIGIIDECPQPEEIKERYHLIVDALFGFSFKPPIRELFVPLFESIKKSTIPIASIDIPSGWDVEKGPTKDDIHPELLISLSAPKGCVRYFRGSHHYLGGRFLPNSLKEKYQLCLPEYRGVDSIVQIF